MHFSKNLLPSIWQKVMFCSSKESTKKHYKVTRRWVVLRYSVCGSQDSELSWVSQIRARVEAWHRIRMRGKSGAEGQRKSLEQNIPWIFHRFEVKNVYNKLNEQKRVKNTEILTSFVKLLCCECQCDVVWAKPEWVSEWMIKKLHTMCNMYLSHDFTYPTKLYIYTLYHFIL